MKLCKGILNLDVLSSHSVFYDTKRYGARNGAFLMEVRKRVVVVVVKITQHEEPM
jgi:hypothetical protein